MRDRIHPCLIAIVGVLCGICPVSGRARPNVLFILVDAFLVWFKRRHLEARSLAMGCLVSAVILLLHSVTDFNLQIPATMFLFAVVLALAWSTAYYRKS